MADTFTPEQIAQILQEFFKVVGTRQYIGARYVPIFGRKGETSIQWDNSAPYEPLTIVQLLTRIFGHLLATITRKSKHIGERFRGLATALMPLRKVTRRRMRKLQEPQTAV